MIALTGKSGSGKTTLLNCIGLLETVSSGKIILDNRVITKLGNGQKKQYFRSIFGFLFQNYGLVDEWTVSENLKIALKYKQLSKSNALNEMSRALEKVGLSGAMNQRVYNLSGGEQQRVALARLMLKKPKIILCDEPSAALDEENTQNTINILRSFATNLNCLVLIATHDSFVTKQCDKIYNLEGNKLVNRNLF